MKTKAFVLILFIILNIPLQAYALSVGDKIYVVFGSGSSAEVESGRIVVVGENNSRVEWDYCSLCSEWVSNYSFYYDSAEAHKYRDKLDSEHTSVGEVVGTVGGIGLMLLLLNEAAKK